jgi:hypothetical protein
VTDEIQIHGLPFSADGRRQDVRVIFPVSAKGKFINVPRFFRHATGRAEQKTPYLISIKHLAAISAIFESSGDTQFAPQFLPRLPRIFIDFSRV